MNEEIIAIGSELLLRQIIDMNLASIAKSLPKRHRARPYHDRAAIHRSEIVITTGDKRKAL